MIVEDQYRTVIGSVARTEPGFALLGVLLILPVVLAFGLTVIDISGWNSLRSTLQFSADQIAYQAAAAMPDRELAVKIAGSAARRLAIKGLNVEVKFSPSRDQEVSVRLRASYAGSVLSALTGFNRLMTAEKESTGALVPKDLVVVLGLGSSLRPAASAGSAVELAGWGSAADWPESGYFNCALPPKIADRSIWPDWAEWNGALFQRWATASCFNPVISSFKLTAIEIVDSAVRSRENRVAAIITPGRIAAEPIQILRRIHSGGAAPGGFLELPAGFADNRKDHGLQALWDPYRESRFFLGDEACLLFSDRLSAFDSRYPLGAAVSGPAERIGECPNPVEPPPCGKEHFPSDSVSSCYAGSGLTLRESIYWRAARLGQDGSALHPAIETAIISGLNQLLEPADQGEAEVERRYGGNLRSRSLKQLIILSDYLDRISERLRFSLLSGSRAGIRTVLAVTAHAGLSPDESAELKRRTAEWKAAAAEIGAVPGGLEIIEAASPDELHLRIGPLLQNLGREVVLKR